MNNAQLINQDSGNQEYFSPSFIVEAARRTMGSIRLDPASCNKAQETVQADMYLIKADNGLLWRWEGNVWLNHPFGRDTNKAWISKLVSEFDSGHISQACCITFACTSEAWFKPLFRFPQCYLSPRTNYTGMDGLPVKGVTKGSVVTYLGPNITDFISNFETLGNVVIPATMWRQRAHNHMCDLRVAYENGQREAVTV